MNTWRAPFLVVSIGVASIVVAPLVSGCEQECTLDADCSDGLFCNGEERCIPSSPEADATGCVPALDPTPCVAGEQECNEAMNRCVALCDVNPDVDSDGFTDLECGGTDCNDSDSNAYPGNLEVCDPFGHDEDCDPTTYGDRDLDGDGNVEERCLNVAPDGTVFSGDDCDDVRADVSPDSPELCNGRDDDCDGTIDEGAPSEGWYADRDRDGYGAGDPDYSCPVPDFYVRSNNDCNDANPAIVPGEMRCGIGGTVVVCQSSGEWGEALTCPFGTTCLEQPNGTGLCLEPIGP